LKKPNLKKIHLFSTKKDSQEAEKLTKSLLQAFVDFGIHVPEVNKKLDCPETLDEFRAYLLQVARDGKFSKEDLMLVVFSFGGEDLEDATYNALKRASFQNLFPLQFVDIDSIGDAEGKDLRKDIVNPLMLQIVAKGGGQPYGLQPGFAPAGTLFVAIDRHRNPFRVNSPLVTSVVLFDSNGSYACSKSVINQMDNEVNLSDLLKECFDKLSSVTHQERWNLVVYMEDTGIGTIEEQLSKDASECCFAAKEIGAKYVFITANKGSHHRLYSGDPNDRLSASRVPSFTAALKMNNPYNILVVSTEPIITKTAKEIGTPRPVLYTIFSLSAELDLDETKEDVAKSIIWLCRHSWVSPTSTRLPAPLYFGNKLSKLVSETETPVSPNDMEAPLFL
jgi:argonaute-like protein implicated in RNA metabolism and viral defense